MSESCNSKIPFPTKEQADGARITAQTKYDLHSKLIVYQCKNCQLWHLTSAYEDD